jgi:predicted house-cleaning noncanonical NTP pyrophosphatase (MazG superfamily)
MNNDNKTFISNKYPKLVRDKIPELINKDGQQATFVFANNDNDFNSFLKKKIIEEANELVVAKNSDEKREEAADLLDIIEAFLKFNKLGDIDYLSSLRDKKSNEKGSFDKRIIMTSYKK